MAGGSEGIGAAFAEELARRGLDLVLIAERDQPLGELAGHLHGAHGVAVRTRVIDLGGDRVPEELAAAARGVDIGLGVYNAAFSEVRPFVEQSLEAKQKTLDVNARGALTFCHWLAPSLAARGRGGLLLMCSLAGLQGTPRVASYAATKAFDLVLAESLWHELRPRGADVLGAIAGATRTPGFLATKPRAAGALSPPVMEPRDVACEALNALGSGPSCVIGASNRAVAAVLARVLGRRLAVGVLGRAMRAQYG